MPCLRRTRPSSEGNSGNTPRRPPYGASRQSLISSSTSTMCPSPSIARQSRPAITPPRSPPLLAPPRPRTCVFRGATGLYRLRRARRQRARWRLPGARYTTPALDHPMWLASTRPRPEMQRQRATTKVVSAFKARQNLGQILDEARYQGSRFLVERAGKPMAVVVGIEEWENILETLAELNDPEYLDSIREARREIELGQTLTLDELKAELANP